MARYSSYGDRTSNIYQEIRDSDPKYSEIGHVNSVMKKRVDYDNRPAPEIPEVSTANGLNRNENGYEKLEFKTTDPDVEQGKRGNDYTIPSEQTSPGKSEEDPGDNRDSYLQFISEGNDTYDKPKDITEIIDECAKPNKRNKNGTEDSDEGVIVEPQGIHNRLDSEIIMEDNTDIYNQVDEIGNHDGITAQIDDAVFQNIESLNTK